MAELSLSNGADTWTSLGLKVQVRGYVAPTGFEPVLPP